MYGCNVANDGSFLEGHYRLTYYGYDSLILNEDLNSWTTEGKVGGKFNPDRTQGSVTEGWRTYLKGECTERFLRCLDLGKETLLRSGKRGPCQPLLLSEIGALDSLRPPPQQGAAGMLTLSCIKGERELLGFLTQHERGTLQRIQPSPRTVQCVHSMCTFSVSLPSALGIMASLRPVHCPYTMKLNA